MTLVIPFGHTRKFVMLIGRNLAFVSWEYRCGIGKGRYMWLTSRQTTFWHRWR